MATVSIIVPVYNKENFIKKTLESIARQKYKDYEVIIVNDGSTDNSMHIVREYQKKDKRIVVIEIDNGGVSNARNEGLKIASGKWIQFLDGDDLIDENYLSIAVEKAEDEQVEILFSDFKMVDENEMFLRKITSSFYGSANRSDICRLFMETQYINGFFGFISNKLIKKSLIEESNAKFKRGLVLAEDLDFYIQLYGYVKKAFFLETNSFFYMQTENNYLNKQEVDYYSQLLIQMSVKQWFVKTKEYFIYKKKIDKKISEYVFFCLYYTKEYFGDLKKEYLKIKNNKKVIECIEYKEFSGLKRLILYFFKTDKYFGVWLVLNIRFFMRDIYRRLL